MGSTKSEAPAYLTVLETMKRLGHCRATVYKMVGRGHLRYYREDLKTRGILLEDIESWERSKLLKKEAPVPFNKESFLRVCSQVRMLQMQMEMAMKMLGIRQRRLQLTDAEFVAYYSTALQNIREGWSPHSEQLWIDMFSDFRLEDMERLAGLVSDPEPWKTFYQLCSLMQVKLFNEDLKSELEMGRQNLAMLTRVMHEHRGHPSRLLESTIDRDILPGKRETNRVLKLVGGDKKTE